MDASTTSRLSKEFEMGCSSWRRDARLGRILFNRPALGSPSTMEGAIWVIRAAMPKTKTKKATNIFCF